MALELVELKLKLDWLERVSLMAEALGFKVMVVWGTPLMLTRDRLTDRRFDLVRVTMCPYCSSRFTRLSISYLLDSVWEKRYLSLLRSRAVAPSSFCLAVPTDF